MNTISLDAAITLTSWSRRTWWRRLSEGEVTRVQNDSRGRAMLSWAEVKTRLVVNLDANDLLVLEHADAGHAESQNDLGLFLASVGRQESALYWIRQASEQNYPDAMQWLAKAYAAGEGVEKNENLALVWLAKAAAAGHVIANKQVKNLLT